jgi:thiamine-phosphate pyrophosphorylase
MPARCLLYYITDRTAFPGDESARRSRLLEKINEAATCAVDYIQLREKDLSSRELEQLAREAVGIVREASRLRAANRELKTRLLINSRTDIALAAGVDGVHLRSDDISPTDIKKIWSCGAGTPGKLRAGSARLLSPRDPLIAVSCHHPEEVSEAAEENATFAVFAPIFEKRDAPGTRPAGLTALEEACQAKIPVLALGGITLDNAQSCLTAGAAGIAGIRLFQENNIAEVIQKLR